MNSKSEKPECREHSDGSKEWFLNGKRHRADGPAIEYSDGTKHWHLNGVLHRTDGPAVERPDERNIGFWMVSCTGPMVLRLNILMEPNIGFWMVRDTGPMALPLNILMERNIGF